MLTEKRHTLKLGGSLMTTPGFDSRTDADSQVRQTYNDSFFWVNTVAM
jgi:hypothetical protein